jgi:hypothetical protein
MRNADKYIWPVFWVVMALFILVVASTVKAADWPFRSATPILLAVFFLAGLVLLVLAIRSGFEKKLRFFLLLAGAAITAMPVFILLHGVVYGLLIKIFGAGFWGSAANSDEPFFFILGIVVCPLAYLVGAAGSIWLLARSGRKIKQS